MQPYPLKDGKLRIFLVDGVDKLGFEFDSSLPTTCLIEAKILFNSIISDAKQRGQDLLVLTVKTCFYIHQ